MVPDFTKQKIPFSLEMVLMDDQGKRIHASVKRTLVYKFKNDLKEGSVYSFQFLSVSPNVGEFRTTRHPYKLIFQISSKVHLMDIGRVVGYGYDLVPFSEITQPSFDTNYLVDVIGTLTAVGTEREYERNGAKTKLNVIVLENDGHRMECTLFGTYVEELNTFLSSGDTENAVVIVQFAKVKNFEDKMHLQNCMTCTKLFFNPSCDEAVKLKKRMTEIMESPSQGLSHLSEASKMSIEEEFLEATPRTTVQGQKVCKEDSLFVVFATVEDIITASDWWYTACVCSRYRIKIRVADSTGNAIFVLFEGEGIFLFNKTCAEMFELEDKISGNSCTPDAICELVHKSFLFKVEVKKHPNSLFEQSFTVKKIVDDVSIINKFKALMQELEVDDSSESGSVPDGKGKLGEGSSMGIGQDLMPKFLSAVIDDTPQCEQAGGGVEDSTKISKEKEAITLEITLEKNDVESDEGLNVVPTVITSGTQNVIDLSTDVDNLTPVKRQSPTESTTGPLKMLKKHIKIEKE